MIKAIQSVLPEDFPWKDHIHWFDTVDSTNTQAKRMGAQGAAHGTILIADSQTGGRGRLGRSFHSPGGSGIYLSILLRPNCHASQLMHLTCATGVAVCNAIESATGNRPGIKWTNDLVFGKRKLGGILTELSLDSQGNVNHAVVGIGINCNQQISDFPEEIQQIATSLALQTGTTVSRADVIATLLTALEVMSQDLLEKKADLMQQYRKDCITVGKEISLVSADSVRHGTAIGVDHDGALLVSFPDGHTEAVNSGEVSVRGMYGYI